MKIRVGELNNEGKTNFRPMAQDERSEATGGRVCGDAKIDVRSESISSSSPMFISSTYMPANPIDCHMVGHRDESNYFLLLFSIGTTVW